MKFLIMVCFLVIGSAHAAEPVVPPKQTTDISKTGEEVYMVYGVTGNESVPFRAKPDEEDKVFGYFPPRKAVWVIRPQEPWALVYFQGVTGWIKADTLLTLFTIDPATGLPQ